MGACGSPSGAAVGGAAPQRRMRERSAQSRGRSAPPSAASTASAGTRTPSLRWSCRARPAGTRGRSSPSEKAGNSPPPRCTAPGKPAMAGTLGCASRSSPVDSRSPSAKYTKWANPNAQ